MCIRDRSKRYAELYNFLMDDEIEFTQPEGGIMQRIEKNVLEALADF